MTLILKRFKILHLSILQSKLKTQIYHACTTQTLAFSACDVIEHILLENSTQCMVSCTSSVAHSICGYVLDAAREELHILPMDGDAFAIKHLIVSCLCTKIISRKSLDKSKQL